MTGQRCEIYAHNGILTLEQKGKEKGRGGRDKEGRRDKEVEKEGGERKKEEGEGEMERGERDWRGGRRKKKEGEEGRRREKDLGFGGGSGWGGGTLRCCS